MSKIHLLRVSRITSDNSGVAAIEFAIVAPIFFLMVFGMLAYAIYFGVVHSVQQLAADAARVSVGGLPPPSTRGSFKATFRIQSSIIPSSIRSG